MCNPSSKRIQRQLHNELSSKYTTPRSSKRELVPKRFYDEDERSDKINSSCNKIQSDIEDEMPRVEIILNNNEEENYNELVGKGLIKNKLWDRGIPLHKKRKPLDCTNYDPYIRYSDDSKNTISNYDLQEEMFNAFSQEMPLSVELDETPNTEELLKQLLKSDDESEYRLFITRGGKLRKKKRSSRKTKRRKSKKGKKSRKH